MAVSEPSNNGTLTGTLVDGFVYTPGIDAGLVGADIQLNYLVTDTDGHVTQENITIRILAAGDTNAIPVARADVARTNAGSSTGSLFVLGNDFDPDGGGVGLVEVSTPANGTVSFNGSYIINYIPNAGFSGVETITYTIRDDRRPHRHRHPDGVGRHRHRRQSAQSPNPQTDYFYVYQGSSVGFTTAQLLDNDTDPQRQPLTVVAVSEPSNNGTLTGTLTDGFVYTPGTDAGLVGTDIQLNYLVTDTDGHVTQENITIRILAAGDTNPVPVAVPDTAQTNAGSSTGALFVLGNDFDPDGGGVGLVEVSTPANGTVSFNGSYIINYIPNAGFSGVETITYTIRDDRRPHRHRTPHGARRHDGRPAAGGPVGELLGAGGRHAADHAVGGRPERAAAHVDARHPADRSADGLAHRRCAAADLHGADEPADRCLRLRGERRHAHRPGDDHDHDPAGQHRTRSPTTTSATTTQETPVVDRRPRRTTPTPTATPSRCTGGPAAPTARSRVRPPSAPTRPSPATSAATRSPTTSATASAVRPRPRSPSRSSRRRSPPASTRPPRPPVRGRRRSTSPTSPTSACASSTSTSRTRPSLDVHPWRDVRRSLDVHRWRDGPRSPNSHRSLDDQPVQRVRRCRRSRSTTRVDGPHSSQARRSPVSRPRASPSASSSRCTSCRRCHQRSRI